MNTEGYSSLQVANYFIELAREQGRLLNPMQLIKLVYIAHGWCLGINNRPLIREQIEAWQYGPVVPNLYHEVKNYRNRGIDIILPTYDCTPLNENAKSLISEVYSEYGKYDGLDLSNITHKEDTPWSRTWHNPSWGDKIIPNSMIATHYGNLYGQLKRLQRRD